MNDTICAISTPHGKGGISVIRVSGDKALEITSKTVNSKKNIEKMKGFTITYANAKNKNG